MRLRPPACRQDITNSKFIPSRFHDGNQLNLLSHVQNRDILFSMMVGIMVGSIVLISDFFVRSVIWERGGGRKCNNKGSGPLILIGLVLAVLAPLFARMLQLAVSRQREYLADASTAQMTRYPKGMPGPCCSENKLTPAICRHP